MFYTGMLAGALYGGLTSDQGFLSGAVKGGIGGAVLGRYGMTAARGYMRAGHGVMNPRLGQRLAMGGRMAGRRAMRDIEDITGMKFRSSLKTSYGARSGAGAIITPPPAIRMRLTGRGPAPITNPRRLLPAPRR